MQVIQWREQLRFRVENNPCLQLLSTACNCLQLPARSQRRDAAAAAAACHSPGSSRRTC